MAAGNFTFYSAGLFSIGAGSFNLGSNNFNCILLTTSYTPQVNSDTLYSDISANEVVAGGGYASGGTALAGLAWTRSGATSTFAAESPVWAGSTLAARYAAIIRRASTSLAPTDLLLGYVDLSGGGNLTTNASNFQVNWNNASTPASPNTVFTLTHNP